jgi:N utilization substance protein B
MASRRLCREWALQFLFQQDFNRGDIQWALQKFWEDKKASAQSKSFTEELINGVIANIKTLDELIQKYTENWEMKRMNAVDRNVLRLAMYEMHFRADIPPVVSINEAVDLAKDFSSIESGRFVNGILDRARKDLHRPARTPLVKKQTKMQAKNISPA